MENEGFMSDCLLCPICQQEKTGILDKKPYSTYCSWHLLRESRDLYETIRKSRMNHAIIPPRRSDILVELFSEIRRRKFQGEQILAQTS